MPNPVFRSSLSEQVYGQLRDEILSRTYAPGDRLPPERELCKLMQVNRSSVREAIKRLEQARLVATRHGNGTVVLDYLQTGGFELLQEMIMPRGRVDRLAVRSIFECRGLVVPEMARLAAERARPEHLRQLGQVVERLDACAREDLLQILDLDLQFFGVLAQACDNLAYLLMYNSARDVYQRFKAPLLVMFVYDDQARSLYRQVLQRLEARDAPGAEALSRQLIALSNSRALQALALAAEPP